MIDLSFEMGISTEMAMLSVEELRQKRKELLQRGEKAKERFEFETLLMIKEDIDVIDRLVKRKLEMERKSMAK